MMKKICFVCYLLSTGSLLSQWTERIIYDNAIMPQKIVVADIDGDGKTDIISMDQGSDSVNWYKNIGGDFDLPEPVGPLEEGRHIAVGDIDGDGDMDVLGTSALNAPGSINLFIFENLDGNGAFGAVQPIATPNTIGGRTTMIVDIDGDGDNDLLAGTGDDDTLAWYKNLDGNGTFDMGNVIISNYVNGAGFDTGDIDGDGDLDIVAGTLNFNIMSWFENLDGNGSYGPPQEIGSPGSAMLSVFLTDIDGDSDLDVIGSSVGSGVFAWWENLDGLGNYSLENTIDTSLVTTYIYPVDLDNDTDEDVLTLAPGFLRWYENLDGSGNFGAANVIKDDLDSAITVTAADLDNDGDMDPITASQPDDTIFWFENDLLGIPENNIQNIVIHPNPSRDTIFIDSKNETIETLDIFDMLGKHLITLKGAIHEVDVSQLIPGVYFLKIATQNGDFTKKIIIE